MYARDIQGNVHSFGVSGKLIRNALVMYDRETDTLWSQFLSQGVEGPLKGVTLEFVPSTMTDWESWVRMHPDTRVLDKGGRYRSDTYTPYYSGGDAGILGERVTDTRLPTKEVVMGLDINGSTKAYALGRLAETPLVHDSINDIPVVVVYDDDSGVGAAFEALVDGDAARFTLQDNDSGEGIALTHEGTGKRWNAFTGRSLDGGRDLVRIPSHYSFWFAWKDFHPETGVF